MKLIVGLGNPGKSYRDTPHNVGFAVIDALSERFDGVLKEQSKFEAEVAKVPYKGGQLMLAKPTTYMNNSGLSVSRMMRFFKIPLSDVILVVDDADLVLGQLRLRAKGSPGGHNGLKSIRECVGSDAYARVRFGIGRGATKQSLKSFVLKPFGAEDAELVSETVARAADAVLAIIDDGIESAMNDFNTRVNPENPGQEEKA